MGKKKGQKSDFKGAGDYEKSSEQPKSSKQKSQSGGSHVGQGEPSQELHKSQKPKTAGPQIGHQPPRGPPQPQGARSGRSQVVQSQPPQGPPQPQEAWSGRSQVVQSQPPRGPPQPQGAWSRRPQVVRSQPPRGPPQPQGAWSGQPQVVRSQPPQGPPQPQGAWSGQPQVVQSQPPRGPPQPQGAWSGRPQVVQSQPPRGPPQPQGAWSGRPQVVQSQPPQPQGALSERPQVGPQSPQKPSQSEAQFSGREPGKSGKEEKKLSSIKTPKNERESQGQFPVEFAPRIYAPKKSGREIQIASNFFRLLVLDPNITIFHYDVEMEPDRPKYLLRAAWNKFMSLVFPGRLTAFDGKNAYSKGPLTNEALTSATVSVFNIENNRDKEFKVTVKEVRRIGLSCFQNFRERVLQDRSMKILPEAELSVLDIILKNFASDNFVRSGSNFFNPSSYNPKSIDLSDKLCLRFGYFQSAFMGYRLYLNFDLSHKAFYKNCPLLEILHCFKIPRSEEIDVDQMSHFLRNVKVEYALPNNPSSKRIFRINKLVNNAYKQSFKIGSFKKESSSHQEGEKEITVLEYFETEKKCKLRHPELPLLWAGPVHKSIYLPMEFCTIVPDQVYKGLIDPFETRVMVQKSTWNARDRMSNVLSVFRKNDINSHPLLREFGLQVSHEMEKVPARVLDPPGLKTSRNIRVDRGVWKIQDFLNPVSLDKWCILNLDKYMKMQNIDTLKNLIKNKGNDFNMRISDPTKSTINGDSSFMGLKKIFSQLKDMQMVFVIIPETKLVYSRVKAICETQDGILTQCVKSRTVSQDPRKLSTTVQNLLLKVNAKLGGRNHSLDQSSTPQCLNGYVMVVGADVTHSSPGMTIPSAVAVTVTCDPAAFQYSTTTRVQPKGEIIVDLENIMSKHVKEFYRIRQQYPEKIIFFRDGVSEGEMKKVFNEELSALRRACNGFCQPKITFIVVQKRHHTRFYPTSQADEADKNYNVPVGTCVDSEIVHPRDLNFYLVSHSSLLGTARPTKYRLLHDDNKLTDDEIERLSYYLCHLFARCNRSVSYPAPTYNAHLAAARVRAYLEGLNLLSGQDVSSIQSKMKDEISKISPMFFV